MTKRLPMATLLTWFVAGMAAGIVTVGCGGGGLDTVAVRGTVTYDGKPLENGTVRFVPVDEDGLLAVGRIGPGGQFTLATKGTDGVVPGDYKISVQSFIIDESVPKKDRELGIGGKKPAIPQKYSNPETSGLTETIDGSRTIDIDLKAE